MLRSIALCTLVLSAAPAVAKSDKEVSCDYQGQVVKAVQQARLDNVNERDVPAAIEKTNPAWPDNYNNAIPLIAPWVYQQPMNVLRENDLGAVWNEQCLKQ